MPRIRLACCLTLCLAAAAHAGVDNAGTTAGSFLSIGTGAGILSMGGATLGTGHDLHAAAWNPAALGRLPASQFALSHASLASQSSQEWLAAGGRVGRDATRWAATMLYQGDGTFDGRDAFGATTGSFSASSMAFGVQLARPVHENLTAGLGVRWLTDHLADVRGSGLGLDAGLLAHVGAFGFGAAARNVGGSMSYNGSRYDLPSVFGVGTSWSDERKGLRFALDANFPSAYYNDVRVGGEWRWQDRVALRAGYRMELGAESGEPLGGPSFGLGTGANGVWVDYAFLSGESSAQGQHRLGLTMRPSFLNRASRPSEPMTARVERVAAPVATAVAPAPAPQVLPAPAPVSAPEPVAAAALAPADEIVVPDAAFELPPPGAQESNASARTSTKSARMRPSRPVRVKALAMPTAVERAKIAADAVPAPASPAPMAAAVAPASPAPVAAAAPAPAAPAPIAAVVPEPTAPIRVAPVPTPAPQAPAPAPIASAPEPTAPVRVAPVPSPATQAPAPAPIAAAPAPTAPAPAPIAQVASSAPRIVVVSRPAEPAQPRPAPVARPASVVVGDNETLADIARRHSTSVAAIMMENDLVKEKVKKGQKLRLPSR